MNRDLTERRLPVDDEKWHAVNLLYNRLNRGFSYFLWITRIHPLIREHPQFPREHIAALVIKNACIESTLLSVRDIDDFFRSRNQLSHETDLRAADFGFREFGTFLSRAERQSINQQIAHLTYEPIRQPASNEWDTAKLVAKAADAVFTFMKFLEMPPTDTNRSAELRKVRLTLEKAVNEMQMLAEKEANSQNNSAFRDGVDN